MEAHRKRARGAIPPWLPESQAQNEATTRASARAAAEFLASGYHTVFDGMVGPWFLPTFVAGAALLRNLVPEWINLV